jgi:hypothetical protein
VLLAEPVCQYLLPEPTEDLAFGRSNCPRGGQVCSTKVINERTFIVAKHAKPNLTSTLSRNGARGAAALTMASFGFLATAPAAFADDGDHHKKHSDVTQHESNEVDSHQSEGIINVSDNDVLVPIQVCNNYVPINVLGVQVPIEDVAGNIPILSEEGDSEADTGDETCQQAGGIED